MVLYPLRRSGHGLSPVPSGERSAPLSSTGLALEMCGSAELCRERPNRNSRTKYYDSSHADEQDARHPEEPATGMKKLVIHTKSGLFGKVIARFFAQTPIDGRAETEPEDKHKPHNGYHIVIPREKTRVKHPCEIINRYRW